MDIYDMGFNFVEYSETVSYLLLNHFSEEYIKKFIINFHKIYYPEDKQTPDNIQRILNDYSTFLVELRDGDEYAQENDLMEHFNSYDPEYYINCESSSNCDQHSLYRLDRVKFLEYLLIQESRIVNKDEILKEIIAHKI